MSPLEEGVSQSRAEGGDAKQSTQSETPRAAIVDWQALRLRPIRQGEDLPCHTSLVS